MEAFPSIFPKPTVNFNGKVEPSTIVTPMDSGRKRRRRRFSAEFRPLTVVWEMDDWEFGMFQAWVMHKISGGADAFTISLPTGGDGFETITVSLADGKYSYQHKPVLNWIVTAILETEDASVWTALEYATKLAAGHP